MIVGARAGTESLVASTARDDAVATPRRRRRGHERGAAVAALAVAPPRSRGRGATATPRPQEGVHASQKRRRRAQADKMPVCADPAAVLEQQVPMYHLDDDHRYIMIMGVGPEGSDGNYQSFAPFQVPIEYDYDVLDLKHIIQAQLGYEPDEINLRVAGDFRPDESKLGPIFGRWFKEGWHMQASVYPKGWKSALEKYQDEQK